METLETFAELSIGLIGFAGVVSALGRSKLNVRVRSFRVNSLLKYSATVLFASIFPIVLGSYDLDLERVWFISTVMLAVTILLGQIHTMMTYSDILFSDPFFRKIAIIGFTIGVVVFMYLIYGLIFQGEDLRSIYLVGLSSVLALGVFHFCMLVSSIQFDEST